MRQSDFHNIESHYTKSSTKHVSEFSSWDFVSMPPLFVEEYLMQFSNDWPKFEKDSVNPPQHKYGGGGGGRIKSRWSCRMKEFPPKRISQNELSPQKRKKESKRAFSKKKEFLVEFSKNFELKYFKDRMVHIWQLKYSHYVRSVSWYFCFDLIWTQNDLSLKKWKM